MNAKRIVPILAAVALGFTGVTHAGPTLTTLWSFSVSDGAYPMAGLTIDTAGNLFGTTYEGGTGGGGTIFELSGTNHQTLATLVMFGNTNAYWPYAGLMLDGAGNLYGTTKFGGANSGGTVFELSNTNPRILTTLVNFNSNSGDHPQASLISDAAGNLYGTTSEDGLSGAGTVFELSGNSYQTLASFSSIENSAGPTAGLTADAAGNLYGTTQTGGADGYGSVFELSGSNHQTLTTLATFNNTNGSDPYAGLTADAAGNLYGTTKSGGPNGTGFGTVFELSGINHQTLTTLLSFNDSTGDYPEAGLISDAAGNLYGTTSSAIFELSGTNHQTFTALATVTGANESGLTADAAGNLYGTTASTSTVFELSGTGFVVASPPITVATGQAYHFTANTGTGILVSYFDGLTVQTGGTAVVDPAANHANRQLLVLTGAGLTLVNSGGSSTGLVDIGNNDLDLPGALLATVNGQVRQGYAGGTWNGADGIASSSAAASTNHITAIGVIQNNQGGSPLYTAFDGQPVGASDVLVKYTYYGDANLDGVVNGSDYTLIDNGYNSQNSARAKHIFL